VGEGDREGRDVEDGRRGVAGLTAVPRARKRRSQDIDITKRVHIRACYHSPATASALLISWPLGAPMSPSPAAALPSTLAASDAPREVVPLLPGPVRSFTARAAQRPPR
jgi:hypothetical protein